MIAEDAAERSRRKVSVKGAARCVVVLLLSIGVLSGGIAQAGAEGLWLATVVPPRCRPSYQPVFQGAGPHDIFFMDLQADFALINDVGEPADAPGPDFFDKEAKHSPGLLTYGSAAGGPISLAVEVSARGNTRYQECGFRPLSIEFAGADRGVFDGHHEVKLDTHCGFRPGQSAEFAVSEIEATRRIVLEHYVYAMLGLLRTTTVRTRLAIVRYLDPDGNEIAAEWAVLREHEKAAAFRCGMQEDTPDGVPDLSAFRAELLAAFAMNSGDSFLPAHNFYALRDSRGRGHFIPHDFDRTGVIRRDLQSLDAGAQSLVALLEGGRALGPILSPAPGPVGFAAPVQGYVLLAQTKEMRSIAEDAWADVEGDALLLSWIDRFAAELAASLGRTGP